MGHVLQRPPMKNVQLQVKSKEDLLSTFVPFQAIHTASVALSTESIQIGKKYEIMHRWKYPHSQTHSSHICTHTCLSVSHLKLSLQSKPLDEGVSHMIEPLEAQRSLVLMTRIKASITSSPKHLPWHH